MRNQNADSNEGGEVSRDVLTCPIQMQRGMQRVSDDVWN